MSVRDVPCPNCGKTLRVTDQLTGKRVKCKACEAVFTVPAADDGAKPLPDEFKKPTAKPAQPKKPTKAKPRVVEDDPPPAPQPAPHAFLDEDDGPKDYKVAKDDLDVPRCPRCAKELEHEGARICLNCGYDMMERRQHASIKTYKQTAGDVILWWLPAVIWFVVLAGVAGVNLFMYLNLEKWMRENEVLLKDDANPLTGEKEFWVGPGMCNVFCSVTWLFLAFAGVVVIFVRLKSPKPKEVEKKK